MRDFDLIVHQLYGGHDIMIVPIADVHLGAPECMEQEFVKFIAEVKDTPDLYLILGGDLVNNGTRSSVGVSVYRDTMPPHQQKREMANILAPVRDRILCAVPGNHEFRATKESDDCPMYDIMAKLDLEHLYRENVAFMKIQLGEPEKDGNRTNGTERPSYCLTVVHGNGGGILTGGAVNRAERFAYVIDGMDALILGHTHKPFTTQPSKIKIDPRNNRVTMKPFKVICATSWLEYGGYAAQKMLTPSSFNLQRLTLSGKYKGLTVSM